MLVACSETEGGPWGRLSLAIAHGPGSLPWELCSLTWPLVQGSQLCTPCPAQGEVSFFLLHLIITGSDSGSPRLTAKEPEK